MHGECLCGQVSFRVTGTLPDIYQCHCSLCRKVTGSSANAASFVQQAAFVWLSGEARIRTFRKPTGYRTDFCGECGSPVPNPLRDTGLMWIPAGLLDDTGNARVRVHLHLGSAATWERESERCLKLEQGTESLTALYGHLLGHTEPDDGTGYGAP